MVKQERRAYLEAVEKRYGEASKTAKAVILDEFCQVCSYNRKYAIRLLNERERQPKRRPGKKPIYGSRELLKALKRIWLAADQMCSKKLVAAIPLWLPFYGETYERLPSEVEAKLLSMSAATIDRLLAPIRAGTRRKRFCCTKPGSLLRNQIPIRTSNWDISQPGFVEADTVAHCGNSLAGSFIWSLTLTDIHTGWTECRATWNNGATGVIKQIKDIEINLAFPLLGFDCDNGSEFLNHHLVRYFTDHKPRVKFTRSRPYKKNDNAHVEQKNYSHVRQLLGYDRLDNPELVDLINGLYAKEWSLYQNHFSPSLKLLEKKRIRSKYKKKYEEPKTPCQRLLESIHIPEEQKMLLNACHQNLNPFNLKRTIERKMKAIFNMVTVTPDVRKRI
ncbi:MAG: transposase family protein [Candidatus Zixiibacteriota bacterium]